jgi:16S rRNA (uracil1498-N3)-methyltransferase
MDLIIQKTTELGVTKIIPVLAERSVSKADKISRWQKIAREAAEQSGRAIIPEVAETTSLKQLLAQAKNFDLALIPWELEKENNLKKVLLNKTPKSILVAIGPEGGFSQNEIQQAKEAGFVTITLGSRILRTETAGFSLLAALNYHFDQ